MSLLALTTVEWTTVLGTGFAALAALAACVTAVISLVGQRRSLEPHVSAGFLTFRTGGSKIHFSNAGPGLAVGLGYLGFDDGVKYGGIVGTGHLQAGAEAETGLVSATASNQAHFVWLCRDVRGLNHLWSYDGRYRRLTQKEADERGTTLGDFFQLMYPEIAIPKKASVTDSELES